MTGFRTRAVARRAEILTLKLECFFRPRQDLSHSDFNAGLKMGTLCCAGSCTTSTTTKGAAEDIVEHAEDIVETHVGKIMHTRAAETFMTELVIPLTFFGIAKHLIGFGAIFELLLGFLVVGILIGVVLQCQPAVCSLNIIRTRAAFDVEHLVIIMFGRRHDFHPTKGRSCCAYSLGTQRIVTTSVAPAVTFCYSRNYSSPEPVILNTIEFSRFAKT